MNWNDTPSDSELDAEEVQDEHARELSRFIYALAELVHPAAPWDVAQAIEWLVLFDRKKAYHDQVREALAYMARALRKQQPQTAP